LCLAIASHCLPFYLILLLASFDSLQPLDDLDLFFVREGIVVFD
jgi:hypothetical protein